MAVENHILARMSRQELLVSEDRADWFRSCLTHIALHEKATEFAASPIVASSESDDDFWPKADDWRSQYRPYTVVNGILYIPVFGVLLHRFAYQVGRYATGYEYLRRAMRRGLADGNVRAIAWIHDSPGGEVAGCFELADEIYEARGQKPMQSFASEAMYSASYMLGSSPGPISMTRSAGVGSIGVVTAHVDYSKLLEDAGIKITFIYAGKHKVDGNPYEALPEAVKARIQDRIDRLYTIFCQSVARNRGIDEDDVRATEAATFTADEAIEVELADRVGIHEEEIEAWVSSLDAANDDDETATTDEKEPTMTRYTQEQFDKAVNDARSEEQAKATAAQNTAVSAAATTARQRISAIMECAEAKDRQAAAKNVAMNTDMSLEQAKNFLAGMPVEQVEAKTETDEEKKKREDEEKKKKDGNKDRGNANSFAEHMAKDSPEVGAGDDKSGGGSDDAKGENPLVKAYSLAGGLKPKKAA